jgi:hypothetical protein
MSGSWQASGKTVQCSTFKVQGSRLITEKQFQVVANQNRNSIYRDEGDEGDEGDMTLNP